MSEPRDGGPAFPKLRSISTDDLHPHGATTRFDADCAGGMSLRDWFAGQAIRGFIPQAVTEEDYQKLVEHGGVTRLVATAAYEMADAMLKERAK